MTDSLHILVKLEFPNGTARFWDGAGPYMDDDGNIWRQTIMAQGGLDAIQAAINAEAYTLALGLSAVTSDISDLAWKDTQAGNVIGSKVEILIQDCDDNDQPTGEPNVVFTGLVDDINFDDTVNGDEQVSAVTIEVRNRFTLRRLINGSVLSDVDQRAKAIDPNADPDRFCERVPGLAQKTINWPAWN